MKARELTDEDQIMKIKIIELEKPYLWYKVNIGGEFLAIDFRYEDYYQVITFHHDSIGFISKKCCEILEVIKKRAVPEFPFMVKVLKNSGFPQCWYASRIGEKFEVVCGSTYGQWYTKNSMIRKGDCEILNE